jgi:hypothetical protein
LRERYAVVIEHPASERGAGATGSADATSVARGQ